MNEEKRIEKYEKKKRERTSEQACGYMRVCVNEIKRVRKVYLYAHHDMKNIWTS